MKTIKDLQAAIDPMQTMLLEKGKARPEVSFRLEANCLPSITLSWDKFAKTAGWDREYKSFVNKPVAEIIGLTLEFIKALPDAKTARLHDFMGQLGKVIDAGRDLGIEVDYLNPLTETMKRLSDNILTHQPA